MSDFADTLVEFQSFLTVADEAIIPSIVTDDRLSARERLAVYFDAYRIRLMDALKLDFEKTHTLLGDDYFEKACLQYLDKYPSTHFSVRYFGQCFAEFLAQQPPYNQHSLTAEMADFEWTINHCIDAADASILTTEKLAKIPPEDWADLVLHFHPSVQLRQFYWDTPQLWQHIDEEKPQREPIFSKEPIAWLFWRKGIKALYRSLSSIQEALFQGLKTGDSFGLVCDKLSDVYPEEDIPVICAQTLYQWCTEEVMMDYDLQFKKSLP